MFVWHAAQSDRRVACLTIGMSRDVAEIVTGLSARELRYIAARHSSGIGPRWRYSTEWWGALLVDGQVSLQTTRFDAEGADGCCCGAHCAATTAISIL